MPGVPHVEEFSIDQTVVASVCGFPVERRDLGTATYRRQDRGDGTLVEEVRFTGWRITWTNPTNGQSVSSQRAYFERDVYDIEGTSRHIEAGLVAHLTIPGQGQVAGNAGHLLVSFDAEASWSMSRSPAKTTDPSSLTPANT